MGCCSPFTAVATGATPDPSRHVNFTTGMVLGVDDYRQEFAYHAARDKWIVREFLGYGTLSGLAVSLESDASGPRIRVTPGAAAAPSGQLICVGREQCGGINAWLARADVAEKLRTLTDGTLDPDHATLSLFLTLRYVDCAVAEVPIPGEPCRSDEALMAPSRIADDYLLRFDFDPPAMTEALAGPVLDAFWASIINGPINNQAAFDDAVRRATLQLQLALGVYPADAPAPVAADLQPLGMTGDALPAFRAAIKRLWVTKLRPQLAAQRCGGTPGSANDCVLLARLTVPVVRVANHWEVDPAGVLLDESDRPLLLSGATAGSAFGAEIDTVSNGKAVTFITSAATIAATASLAIIRSASAITVKLPSVNNGNFGQVMTVRTGGGGAITLGVTGANNIDGNAKLALAPGASVSLRSDGVKTWRVTGLVQ